MLGSVAATVCSCVLGAVWYHPKFPTGSTWMSRTHPGKTAEEVADNGKTAMGLSVVSTFTMSLLLRFILVDFLHVKTVVDGVKFAVGLSCLTTLLEVPHRLFSNHSVDAFIIDQVYNVMSMITTALLYPYCNDEELLKAGLNEQKSMDSWEAFLRDKRQNRDFDFSSVKC